MKTVLIFVAIGCLLAMSFAQDIPEEEGVEGVGAALAGSEDGANGLYGAPVGEGQPLEHDDVDDEELNEVKDKNAAGHHRYGHFRRRQFFGYRGYRGGYGGYGGYPRRRAYVERSTCSVQATYWLSLNQERRHCRDAVYEHDDCQACCEASTRRETRGVDKDDVTGFIAMSGLYGPYRGKRDNKVYSHNTESRHSGYRVPERECVCCVPKKHGNYYY